MFGADKFQLISFTTVAQTDDDFIAFDGPGFFWQGEIHGDIDCL